ncbi:short chain dehydrogenase [Amycolatopsis echigonensis]|uniref:NAD(P)-dependent dehydrogenase (Short-subunit alcohol dehydrogenase family) n=1 Tax=Amycolatopsis echigonensis TaxID=2576905 RepID=A0A2N3WU20_9PSEU|nr:MULTISPECIES: short chain dehydrogenase [Amycolatopsis]MBB2505757.1 short chain dehydrogenase [Amycolatopsis echigonensis]PKV97370.1 NAD(P)-dependent dehydrogenase (short-subunit alcohol dehydrogenase family) [Amycolatopsis niigatensis]
MRILVVGGAGTIGRRLVPELRSRGHDVIMAGRTSGQLRVDLAEPETIAAMYREAGAVDAVVSVAAHGALDEFAKLTSAQLHENMRAKFYGQVELVLQGQHYAADGASFTLTSGIFADEAWPHVTGGGVISGALHSFVLSAAIELPRRMRVNVVSPTLVGDSEAEFGDHFPGMRPVPMDELVQQYLNCVESDITGTVVRAYA